MRVHFSFCLVGMKKSKIYEFFYFNYLKNNYNIDKRWEKSSQFFLSFTHTFHKLSILAGVNGKYEHN